MAGYRGVDPGAFTNAFNTQRQMGANMRQADEDNAFRSAQVARVERLDKVAADKDAAEQQRTAFPRIGALATQISALGDPQQKRLAFKQAITQNAPLFDTMGMPSTEALAKLDTLDDAGLDATLQSLARFAPQAAAQEVTAGNSLVRAKPGGGFENVYTAPKETAPDSNLSDVNAENFTGASIDKFRTSGNYSDLVPRVKPADPAAQASALAGLRDDFRQDSKVFQGVADAYQRVSDSAADPSGAGDIALLYNYLKVLDPASTVREGEFATVGSSGGLPTQVQGFFSKMVNGKLPDELRGDVVNRATRLYRGQEQRFNTQVLDRSRGLYKRAGGDPNDLADPRAKVPTAALPQKNAQGWMLAEDAQGNRAYVSPDGKQFDEVN